MAGVIVDVAGSIACDGALTLPGGLVRDADR
jgi:hypothetical protein